MGTSRRSFAGTVEVGGIQNEDLAYRSVFKSTHALSVIQCKVTRMCSPHHKCNDEGDTDVLP